jgi:hypothetical protein
MMDLKHTFRHFCSTLRGGGGGGGGGGHAAQFLLTQDNFASAPDLPPIDKAAMVAAYLERHKNSDFGFQVPLVLTISRKKPLGKYGQIAYGQFCGSGSGSWDPMAFWHLDPGCVKNQDSGYGSGMKNPDHISESLETVFLIKILRCGSGIFMIWDLGWINSDLGSGIRKLQI